MPTILRIGPYRFFFYASDGREPPHVHVERDDAIAKFWLAPVRLGRSGRIGRNELNTIASLIAKHETSLLEAWYEYFGS